VLSGIVFIGQIVGKWTEGGWVVLITFSMLVVAANALLISPIGIRDPKTIHRIVREKARVQARWHPSSNGSHLKCRNIVILARAGIDRCDTDLRVVWSPPPCPL